MIRQGRLRSCFVCSFLFFSPSKLSLSYFLNRYPDTNQCFLPWPWGDLRSGVSNRDRQPVNAKVQRKAPGRGGQFWGGHNEKGVMIPWSHPVGSTPGIPLPIARSCLPLAPQRSPKQRTAPAWGRRLHPEDGMMGPMGHILCRTAPTDLVLGQVQHGQKAPQPPLQRL